MKWIASKQYKLWCTGPCSSRIKENDNYYFMQLKFKKRLCFKKKWWMSIWTQILGDFFTEMQVLPFLYISAFRKLTRPSQDFFNLGKWNSYLMSWCKLYHHHVEILKWMKTTVEQSFLPISTKDYWVPCELHLPWNHMNSPFIFSFLVGTKRNRSIFKSQTQVSCSSKG